MARAAWILLTRGAGPRRVPALHRADRVRELAGPVAGRHRHRHRGSQFVRQIGEIHIRLLAQQSDSRVVLIVTMMQR